jgi:four helix bundle protein
MMLDHEGLDVYQLALDFLVIANTVIEGFPRGRSHLADQFTRASLSIVLNIAEGAGKHSKPDKRRYYSTARVRRPNQLRCWTLPSAHRLD